MSFWIDYMTRMFLVSGVLYGYYHLMLRDKRFHLWNRFYLLCAVLLSVCLPLLHIPVTGDKEVDYRILYATWNLLNHGNFAENTVTVFAVQKRAWFLLSDLPGLLYSGIIVGQLAVFAWQLGYLRRLFLKSPHVRLDRITLVETRAKGTPYSFFRWIFWNQELDLHSADGQQVLRHELTHVHQRHSLDKIILQLLCTLFFPVIFLHLIRRELQIIHEYLADKEASEGGDLSEYARLLVGQAFETAPHTFASSFFQNPIKRRIAMMNCFSNPRYTYLRKIMFLPLAVVLFGLLAFRVEAKHPIFTIRLRQAEQHLQRAITMEMSSTEPSKPACVPNDTVPDRSAQDTSQATRQIIIQRAPASPKLDSPLIVIDGKRYPFDKNTLGKINPARIESITVWKDKKAMELYGSDGSRGVIEIHLKQTSDSTALAQNDVDKIFTAVEVPAQFPGGDMAWADYVRKVLTNHMDDLVKDRKSGTCEVQFIVDKDGTISGVQALTMQDTKLAKIAVAAINAGPRWIPAQQNGRYVKAFRHQKITFQMPN